MLFDSWFALLLDFTLLLLLCKLVVVVVCIMRWVVFGIVICFGVS